MLSANRALSSAENPKSDDKTFVIDIASSNPAPNLIMFSLESNKLVCRYPDDTPATPKLFPNISIFPANAKVSFFNPANIVTNSPPWAT